MMNPFWVGHGPGYQRPPQMLHSKASGENKLLLGLGKIRGEERRKASKETARTVEGETHTNKGGGKRKRLNSNFGSKTKL